MRKANCEAGRGAPVNARLHITHILTPTGFTGVEAALVYPPAGWLRRKTRARLAAALDSWAVPASSRVDCTSCFFFDFPTQTSGGSSGSSSITVCRPPVLPASTVNKTTALFSLDRLPKAFPSPRDVFTQMKRLCNKNLTNWIPPPPPTRTHTLPSVLGRDYPPHRKSAGKLVIQRTLAHWH